jgi:hypothetical protein
MNKFFQVKFAWFLAILLMASACAPVVSIEACVSEVPYGFGYGVLHGLIAPFVFIIGLFRDDLAIYAVNNTGTWYDFGFLIGATIIFGGSGKHSSRNRANKNMC